MTRRLPTLNSLLKAASLTATLIAFALAQAQNNPIPQIVGPVHPDAVAPGSDAFTLDVYGANFVPGAIVNWNYQPRATTYVSSHKIQAQILASDVGKNSAGYISVVNPAPGGGSSSASWAQVEVHEPISTITLRPSVYYPLGLEMYSAADFNRDGSLDLLGEFFGLALDLNRGDGTFTPTSRLDSAYYTPYQFTFGDFNNDGNLDAIDVTSLNLDHGVITRMNLELGDGNGNFSSGPPLISDWDDLGFVQVGDFNQDGNLDLVTQGGDFFSIFLGNGDGTFRLGTRYEFTKISQDWAVGDFDDDGKLDLLFLDASLGESDRGGTGISFWFAHGNGDGTFRSPQEVAEFPKTRTCFGGIFYGALQVSDFNGDGKLDVAFCTQAQVGVMLGNGDGTFKAANFYTADPSGQGQFTFATGDINSDTKADLVISQYYLPSTSPLLAFLGNGDGTFQAEETIGSGTPVGNIALILGDFNSDGLLDVVFDNGFGMYVTMQQ